jgi:hypothetical protein
MDFFGRVSSSIFAVMLGVCLMPGIGSGAPITASTPYNFINEVGPNDVGFANAIDVEFGANNVSPAAGTTGT